MSFWLQTAGFVVAKLVLDLCFLGVFFMWFGESMGDRDDKTRRNRQRTSVYVTLMWVITGLQAVPCLCGAVATVLLRHTVRNRVDLPKMAALTNWLLAVLVVYLVVSVMEVALRYTTTTLVWISAPLWLAQVSIFYAVYRQTYEHVDNDGGDAPLSAAQVSSQLKVSMYWHLFGFVVCHGVFGVIFFYAWIVFHDQIMVIVLLCLMLTTLFCGMVGAILMLRLVWPLHQHCMTQLAVAQLALICADAVVSIVVIAVMDPLISLMFYVTPTLWIAQVVCFYVLLLMVRAHLNRRADLPSVEMTSLA